ncbi:MAG TPA: nitroreductase family deazaflavin-dependent oxidoreductase [Acidimicrobiales bacterium]|nr:nitroreductase family deazaflavin-dependent oxidoreductase [Acidimicrobiales bacterium]
MAAMSANGKSGAPAGPRARFAAAWNTFRTRAFKAFTRQHTRLLVRTRGRPSRTGLRLRFLVLETRSRRTGMAHQVVLLYMPGPTGLVVIASNFGAERPPGWWLNLEAGSDALVHRSGRTTAVHARVLAGEERAATALRAAAYNSQWRRYLHTVQRELPIVLLEPRVTPTV